MTKQAIVIDFGEVLSAYVECALWSSTDDDDCPLDANYSIDDIHPDTLHEMRQDVEKFVHENAADLALWGDDAAQQAGHDFWLTRNGHGCGFWEPEWVELDSEASQRLDDAAKRFGECNLYVGDDGLIYC